MASSSTYRPSTRVALAIAGLLATATIIPGAGAQEIGQEQQQLYPPESLDTPTSHWALGLGVGAARKPYAGSDTETHVRPLLMYQNDWVSITGLGGSLKLPSYGPFQFRLSVRYGGGYKADDTAVLNGMEDRKGSLWVGPQVTWRSDVGNLSAEWLGDAMGNSKGQQMKLQFDHNFRVGGLSIRPRVGVTWLSDNYVDYYYGVTEAEATATRPAYAGQASTNPEVGVRVAYPLAPNQVISIDGSVSRFGSGITNSPLVDKSNQVSIRLGYLYRF